MLDTLAHLRDLHVKIKRTTTTLSTKHESMVCRAVSSSITDIHLGRFMDKIMQVESLILQKDAAYVGAYEIVPLSTVVAEFAPWTRRLEWLWSIAQQLDPGPRKSVCGANVLDILENETHTGYSDIEDMAVELLIVAQKTWMRAASLWILYGKLPSSGANDFCIKPNPSPTSAMDEFMIDPSLTPKLVNPGASHAFISAGSAMSQLRSRARSIAFAQGGFHDISMSLLRDHLALLESLRYPLNPSLFESVLSAINSSTSKNALSQILPRPLVMQLLHVAMRYMLLGQGEFAVSLIGHADDRVNDRQRAQTATRPVRKMGKLDGLAVKEAELNGILSKTMAEIAAVQAYDDLEDEILHLAKKLIHLKAAGDHDDPHLIAKLLPMPTLLQLTIPANSPLHMFLSSDDAKLYATINAYLLSIHRADLHLSSLWTLSSQRRCYPSPLGPPRSSTQSGRFRLEARRLRDAQRHTRTRGHWTCASKILFLVNELEAYLQGEVIQSSWTCFHEWLQGKDKSYSSSAKSSRPGTASSGEPSDFVQVLGGADKGVPTDPRAMAEAHRKYLHALNAAIFLTNKEFVAILKELLNQTDHLIALFSRLQTVWDGLDLQEDEGVVDAFSDYANDENEVLSEMDRTRHDVEGLLSSVVDKIRNIEKDKRTGVGVSSEIEESLNSINLNGTRAFVPWQARTVDRLVMKLDGLAGRQDEDRQDLLEGYDDD